MQIALPDLETAVTLTLDPERRFTDDEYFDFCGANQDLNIERTPEEGIVILPPVGGESAFRITEATVELHGWATREGRGIGFGPSVQFLLPDGSGLSPDAAWVSKERLASVPKPDLKKFPHLVPEFVIEVLSPSDRLAAAKRKMRRWAANGVDLGWLIDGDKRCVWVYRGTAEPRLVTGVDSIAGEGPVEGFVLPLGEIWAGL